MESDCSIKKLSENQLIRLIRSLISFHNDREKIIKSLIFDGFLLNYDFEPKKMINLPNLVNLL